MEPAHPAPAPARRRPRRWARAAHRAAPARSGRAAVAIALLTAAALLALGPTGAASATRYCPPPQYPSLGYFDRITVTGVGCATGNRLAFAYYRCRTRAGDPAGRCPGGVLGFRCHEVRNASATEIIARVTCRRGRTTVVHVYTQDLPG